MSRHITRRELLKLTGAAAAMVPLLESRPSRAQPPSGLKRLVIMCWPNGVNREMFWPSAFGPGSADYNGPMSGITTWPTVLKPIKTKNVEQLVLMPRNVINAASLDDPRAPSGHECYFHLLMGMPSVAGSAGGPSLDQYVASKLPGITAFQSLQFGVFSTGYPSSCASWRGLDAPLVAENRPAQMFDALFGGGMSQAEQVQLRRRKLSILDKVYRDLTTRATRLGTNDRRRIDDHLDAVRQLEKQLDPANLPDPVCVQSAMRQKLSTNWSDWDTTYSTVHDAQFQMLQIALSCGLTQVVSYQFMDAHMEFFNLRQGSPLATELYTKGYLTTPLSTLMNGHQDIAHFGSNAGTVENYNVKNALDAWHVEQFARLVDYLNRTPDGSSGQMMLANTVVMLINQFNNGGSHFTTPSPLLVAGGSFFREGQVVDCKNQPLNNLYVSVCNALGLADVNVFATDKYGKGPLVGGVR